MKISTIKFTFLFCLLIAVGVLSISWSGQTNYHFVQFRVITIPDADAARLIDEKIKSKSGVIESRADHITSTYFCLLNTDSGYKKEDFINWFSKLGYAITCYSKGVQNSDVMISPHILKDCVE